MFATTFTESVVEDAALAWLEGLGWAVKHGLDILSGGDPLTLTLFGFWRDQGAKTPGVFRGSAGRPRPRLRTDGKDFQGRDPEDVADFLGMVAVWIALRADVRETPRRAPSIVDELDTAVQSSDCLCAGSFR